LRIPLHEYDSCLDAIIDPKQIKRNPRFPDRAILCYFNDALRKLLETHKSEKIDVLYTAMGEHPVYLVDYHGNSIIIMHPGVGAPLTAGMMEELISLGCRKFINFGGAGVFENEISFGSLILIESAIRDEGTSYHYQPASRLINVSNENINSVSNILKLKNIPYIKGKCWTTDAFYRETRKKVQMRKAEGALCVDMECSALIAVSKFRKVDFVPILMAADYLSDNDWIQRTCNDICSLHFKLLTICIEVLLSW
jgi:uridine phosphorylase